MGWVVVLWLVCTRWYCLVTEAYPDEVGYGITSCLRRWPSRPIFWLGQNTKTSQPVTWSWSRVKWPTWHNEGGNLHSQSLDWYWQITQYTKIHKLNTTQELTMQKYSKTKRPWFLWHSARKRDGFILQHSRADTWPILTELNITITENTKKPEQLDKKITDQCNCIN